MENNKLKVCSFYVSDWHLTAMLLPFIEENVQKDEHLDTILGKNILYNMKEILTRINISDRIKEQILKIDWKNKNIIKYGDIRKFMEKTTKGHKNITVIVEGTKERIEIINSNIDRWMQKQDRKLQRKNIRIINCYEVTEFNENLQEILDKHDNVLNTSGIHDIEEIYAGYTKKRA